MRLNMHKLKNKFKRLFMSAATIGTACLLAGCGAGAAAGTDNSSVTESQSGVNGSEQGRGRPIAAFPKGRGCETGMEGDASCV